MFEFDDHCCSDAGSVNIMLLRSVTKLVRGTLIIVISWSCIEMRSRIGAKMRLIPARERCQMPRKRPPEWTPFSPSRIRFREPTSLVRRVVLCWLRLLLPHDIEER